MVKKKLGLNKKDSDCRRRENMIADGELIILDIISYIKFFLISISI